MAILTQQYARSLCEQIEEQEMNEEQLRTMAKNFVSLLKKHHRLADAEKIIKKINSYYANSEDFSLNVFIEYAKYNPEKEVAEFLKKHYPNKEFKIKSEENPELTAGAKIRINSDFIDYSLQSYLDRVKRRITQKSVENSESGVKADKAASAGA